MKLDVLHLDWMPVIPDGKHTGVETLKDMRDSTCFRAVDGWTILKLPSGEFELTAEWLPNPVVIGDGYTYVATPIAIEPDGEPLGEPTRGICPVCHDPIADDAAHCGARKCRRTLETEKRK